MGMLRVISGSCKGRKLKTVKGVTTRPTADRMREALFNIMASKIPGAVILDLFAGTGALGIEALSRGAKYSVFIEKDKNALSTINENILLCQMSDKAKTIQWDIVKNLACIESTTLLFDIVFMDPPYKKNVIKKTIDNLRKTNSLKKNTDIIVEHASEKELQCEASGYEIVDQRTYGRTAFSFLRVK
jgi:16S rRNA (guanine966-N2)-methyltransferase